MIVSRNAKSGATSSRSGTAIGRITATIAAMRPETSTAAMITAFARTPRSRAV